MQIASAAGVRVVLDCGGAEEPFHEDMLRHISILSPNETELARLTGTVLMASCEQKNDPD